MSRTVPLNARERRALDGIEAGLSRDASLRRRLRLIGLRARAQRLGRAPALRPGPHLLVLLPVSLFLLVAGITTSAAGFIWAFAGCWLLTGITLLRLLSRTLRGPDRRFPPRPFV
ncbi:DUF3040 domain-containing protein [Streptomyces sp. NPDC004609]|uniref:DUF3040 domain-containing protein n=1 Tax=Streptomyces sp. NPDC004609 TaxID=3364704 RepID=UPI0036B6CFA8